MTAADLASIVLTLLSSAVIVVGGIRWYVQTQMKPVHDKVEDIYEMIEDVRKETKTNGGSSMRDEIKAIKLEQEHARDKRKQQSDKIDHLYDLFVDYISRNK